MQILQYPSPNHFDGRDGYKPIFLILHGTAGGTSAVGMAQNWFDLSSSQVSSHYLVDQQGVIVKCVEEVNGAWSNAPTEPGCDSWWLQYPNPNFVTIAIEHLKANDDNSNELTDTQQAASFALIKDICERWSIPMRQADANGGITGHFSIAPSSRRDCPGTFDWQALWTFLAPPVQSVVVDEESYPMGVPHGWSDENNSTLIAPNGHKVVLGFRNFILTNSKGWNPEDYPLQEEVSKPQLEISNPSLGGGSQQLFRMSMLAFTPQRGVFKEWLGCELQAVRAKIGS